MRRTALLLLLAISGSLAAQEGEPEEPKLVLPTFILSVEDVGVEGIEAGIPADADLLPPERSTPLPESNELEIREPGIVLAPPGGEAAGQETAGVAFFAEGQVGAGTLHQLVTELAIYRPGRDPGFKLAAAFDMRDGLGGQAAGAGFHRKTAGIEGRLDLRAGTMGLEVLGTFNDQDTGLQGQGQPGSRYGSRVLRSTRIEATGSYDPGALMGLTALLTAEATTLLLTRDSPDTPQSATGYRLRPGLRGELHTGPFRAALELVYGLTVDTQTDLPAAAVHRFSPRLTVGLDLPLHLSAQASVGWQARVGASGSVPFRLEVSGNPVDPLWLRVAGGYRVIQQDRADAMTLLPWSLPATPAADERGWFGLASVRVTVAGILILSGGAEVSSSQSVATLAIEQDASGLYAVEVADMTRFAANAGILWDIVRGVSTRLEYRREFLGRRWFEPTDVVTLGASASLASGRVQLDLTGRFELVPEVGLQIPRLDVGGSLRITPNLRMVADVSDVLGPLGGSPRGGVGPFVEPGFGASVRVLVSL